MRHFVSCSELKLSFDAMNEPCVSDAGVDERDVDDNEKEEEAALSSKVLSLVMQRTPLKVCHLAALPEHWIASVCT